MSELSLPLRVTVVNDHQLVVAGVAHLLSQFPGRLIVRDRILVGEPVGDEVDVALYDTYGRMGAAGVLKRLIETPEIGKVAVFSLDLSPALVNAARQAGASGFLSKSLSGEAIASGLTRIAAGEVLISRSAEADSALWQLDWPGKSSGLSERESEVLLMIGDGLSNAEIAEGLYIGVETVRTHVRRVLAKLEVRNRAQAAVYVNRYR